MGLGAGLLISSSSHAQAPWFEAFSSLSTDIIHHPLKIKGSLPPELKGHLFRAGPVHFEQPNGTRYGHWFDGDGGILDIELDGQGGASASMRRLNTPGFQAEQAAGEILYPSYGTPTKHALVKVLRQQFKNVANTNVISWDNQLLALVESAPPTQVDPTTLERIDATDFGGLIQGGFCAHPHRHANGKTLFNVGMELGRKPRVHIYALGQNGNHRRMHTIDSPHCAMLHDFALTAKHIVLIQPPLHLDFKKVLEAKGAVSEGLVWDPKRGTQITVIPLSDPKKTRHWTVDPFYQWHIGNAWESGADIVIDLVKYSDFSSNQALGILIDGKGNHGELNGRLSRLRFNTHSGQLSTEFEASHSGEFPQSASSVWSDRNRQIYLAEHSSPAVSRAGLPDTLSRYDLDSGHRQSIQLSASSYPSEPIVVPKANAHHPEDCWILSVVYDAQAQCSTLAILDSERFSEGPIATAAFDQPIPMTFHGHWHGNESRIGSVDKQHETE